MKTKIVEEFIKETEKEFDDKFVSWVVLGSTLNGKSVRRRRLVEQEPEDILSFYKTKLRQAGEVAVEEYKIIKEIERATKKGKDNGIGLSREAHRYLHTRKLKDNKEVINDGKIGGFLKIKNIEDLQNVKCSGGDGGSKGLNDSRNIY